MRLAQDERRLPRLSRRQFLVATAVAGAAGTGLVIGVSLHARQTTQPAQTSSHAKPFTPNAWLRIGADNRVTVTVARSEMGQGVLTALAMVAADELDADWSRVRAEQAPPGTQYGNQRTTGSASVSESYVKMRQAGAQARALLVAAAAHTWGVDASACRTQNGGRGEAAVRAELTQAARPVSSDRHARATARHTGEGGWQRSVRPGYSPSRHAVRDSSPLPGARRHSRQVRCESYAGDSWRTHGRAGSQRRCGGRRAHLGGNRWAARARHHLERRHECHPRKLRDSPSARSQSATPGRRLRCGARGGRSRV